MVFVLGIEKSAPAAYLTQGRTSDFNQNRYRRHSAVKRVTPFADTSA